MVNLREVRIIPQCVGYVMDIVYENETGNIENVNAKPEGIMGIDTGMMVSILTIVKRISKEEIALRDCVLRFINQFLNKEIARYRSIKDITCTNSAKQLFGMLNQGTLIQ